MKASPWKNLIGAAGALAALAGCVVVPAPMAPVTIPSGSNAIIGQCKLGQGYNDPTFIYGTAGGDLYQTTVRRDKVDIIASLANNNIVAWATDFNGLGLQISRVTGFAPVQLPSELTLSSTYYDFQYAAGLARRAYAETAYLPRERCPDSAAVTGIFGEESFLAAVIREAVLPQSYEAL